jgi:hypothetical protein
MLRDSFDERVIVFLWQLFLEEDIGQGSNNIFKATIRKRF